MTGYATAKARALIVKKHLLRHGVPEVSIELRVGRPSGGDDWNACRPVGVQSHHIASHPTPASPTPGLALVKVGRSDLPGPLCNGTAGVDLVYRIITLGYANHPGEGGPLTLRGSCGAYTIPRDNGRAYLWGTEYEGGYDDATWDRVYTNKRTGKSMTFREFMGRCNAALVEAIWEINGRGKTFNTNMPGDGYHIEHSTWTPRKVDRRNYSTQRGRDELKKWNKIAETAASKPPKPELPKVVLKNIQLAAEGKIKHPLPGLRRLQQALNKEMKVELKVDGRWGGQTRTAYRLWQEKAGNPPRFCDGIPGPNDLGLLGKRRFRVV